MVLPRGQHRERAHDQCPTDLPLLEKDAEGDDGLNRLPGAHVIAQKCGVSICQESHSIDLVGSQIGWQIQGFGKGKVERRL